MVFVMTLTGKVLTFDIASMEEMCGGPKLRARYERVMPEAEDGDEAKPLRAEEIVGNGGVAVKAFARQLAEFWESEGGQQLREQLLSRNYCHGTLVEFSRFMLLKGLHHDGIFNTTKKRTRAADDFQLSPPHRLDEVWHAILLNPQSYAELCSALLGPGCMFNHDPSGSGPQHPRARAPGPAWMRSSFWFCGNTTKANACIGEHAANTPLTPHCEWEVSRWEHAYLIPSAADAVVAF